MNNTSLDKACGSCVPSVSLANILQNSSVISVFVLGQTDVAVANIIKSCIQPIISHVVSLQDQNILCTFAFFCDNVLYILFKALDI
jgi:hypothetical protein